MVICPLLFQQTNPKRCDLLKQGISKSLLRAARVTKYLPRLKGLSILRRMYIAALPFPRSSWTMRVDDFDGNIKLDVDPREDLGVNIWNAPKVWERRERKLFCDAIQPGTVVLDVGANIGLYTLPAAKRGAKVIAIEADPLNATRLRHHLKLNELLEAVTIFECAATDCEGCTTLYRDPGNVGRSSMFSETAKGISVRCRTIDSLKLPPIHLCKMDIEGAEIFALRGMIETIKRSPNLRVLIEYSVEFGHADEMLDFARSHFANIEVVGTGPLSNGSKPPHAYCNLWLSQPV